MENETESRVVGRVLRAGTASFTVGCRTLETDLPTFGSLVRVERSGGQVYGLIYDVQVDDDPFVRQLIAAGDLAEEYVEDQRRRRQVPVEVSVLVVGGTDRSGRVFQHLPPQPPATLSWVTLCTADEMAAFGQNLNFVATVLNAAEAPADELAAAALREMAAVQGDRAQVDAYLVQAGQSLARLLGRDPARLNSILQRMR